MIEIEGKIVDVIVSILIDYGVTYCYIDSNVIEICHLVSSKLQQSKMVLLATDMT